MPATHRTVGLGFIGALLLWLIAAPSQADSRQHALGVGLDLYQDSGTRRVTRINRGAGDPVEDARDITGDKLLAFSLSYLTHVLERVRVGGSFRYFGDYRFALEDNPDDTTTLGQMVELAAHAEYVLPIIEPLDVLLGGQLGMALLFPGGDLDRRIDALQRDGFNTWSTPRIGYVLGPQVGARYKFAEWLALRADFAILWQKLVLIDAAAEGGGLRSEEGLAVSWTRLRFSLMAELMF